MCWSPNERAVVTGGADRKIKLWDLSKGAVEYKGTLVGSNLGINSVTFDSAGTMILGASNDFATRVWSIPDQRLRVSTTFLIYLPTVPLDYRHSHKKGSNYNLFDSYLYYF